MNSKFIDYISDSEYELNYHSALLHEDKKMEPKAEYLKVKLILGCVSLVIGLLAANLALFNWVERTGLYYLLGVYARYVCAYGGFGAMIFGATLINDFLVLRNFLKRKYARDHEITIFADVDKEEEKQTVVNEKKAKRVKRTIMSLAVFFLMACPLVASSLVSYTARVVITPKLSAFVYYRSNTQSYLLSSCKERMWNSSAWSSTEKELSNAGSAVQYVRAAYCPNYTRWYEKIVVTLSNDGYLDANVWNGNSWLVTNNIGYVGTTVNAYRSYDIAYESASGKAMLVYAIYSTDTTKDLAYKIWNGNQWSSEAYINDPSTSDIQYYWVHLASYPLLTGRTNEIALIASEATTSRVNAWIWSGSSWGNNWELETSVSSTTYECISVEYEQQSGDAMFIWGYHAAGGMGGTGYMQSRKWTGSWGSELTQVSLGSVYPYWFTLKADPASNRLMTVSVDSGSALNTIRWDGSAWTKDSAHDTSVDASSTRCADFSWEPSGSKGLLVWGTSSGSLSYKTFTAPSSWSGTSTKTAAGTHPWVQLRRNTRDVSDDAKILGAMLNSNYDLGALKWDGSTLTNMGDAIFTSDTTTTTFECFDIRFSNPS